MNRTTLPLSEIIVLDRYRKEYKNQDRLMNSMQRMGLIQPLVVNQKKELVAGGRRIDAAKRLGWKFVDVVFKETLTDADLFEMELEENVCRENTTWQEECLQVKKIHEHKAKQNALISQSWGQRETAALFGLSSVSSVNYAIQVAEYLLKGDKEITECGGLTEAWRVLFRRKEEQALSELARQTIASRPTLLASFDSNESFMAQEETIVVQPTDVNKDLARQQYLSNPLNDPNTFNEYYAERQQYCSKIEQDRATIPLSRMLFKGDAIDFMNQHSEVFDAIITDIPYGIDVSMMQQNSGEMVNIETVVEEHTVEGNEELFVRFFPAAYGCLKPNTFLITWADMWQWRYMADLAIEAGFKIQRWPLVWIKTYPCMNQSANVNFTKTFEVALVCRKGTPTLYRTNTPAHILAGMDEYKEQLNHPFVKPFQIWEHLIDATTLQGHCILEPFAGRGSGVISMLRKNRRVIGCELNDAHYNSLVENVRNHYLSVNPNFLFT